MRKFLLILMAAALLAGCNSEKPLRVLYWNIQNGMWDGQTDNYRRFTEWVAAQNPDICVWAESVSLYYSNILLLECLVYHFLSWSGYVRNIWGRLEYSCTSCRDGSDQRVEKELDGVVPW